MHDLFQQLLSLPTPFNMIVLIVLMFAVAGVITSVVKQLRKYACHRQDVAFKQELVDRGLGAEEIERIVAARPHAAGGSQREV